MEPWKKYSGHGYQKNPKKLNARQQLQSVASKIAYMTDLHKSHIVTAFHEDSET